MCPPIAGVVDDVVSLSSQLYTDYGPASVRPRIQLINSLFSRDLGISWLKITFVPAIWVGFHLKMRGSVPLWTDSKSGNLKMGGGKEGGWANLSSWFINSYLLIRNKSTLLRRGSRSWCFWGKEGGREGGGVQWTFVSFFLLFSIVNSRFFEEGGSPWIRAWQAANFGLILWITSIHVDSD